MKTGRGAGGGGALRSPSSGRKRRRDAGAASGGPLARRRTAPAGDGRRLHRTIWYMGVKARVIPDFLERIVGEEVPAGGTVVDLMSGTGVVAAYLASRYRVFAGDVQEYAQVIARSLLEHDPERKDEFLEALDLRHDLRPVYEENVAQLEAMAPRSLEKESELLAEFEARRDGDAWCRAYREFLEATTLPPGGPAPTAERPAGSDGVNGVRELAAEMLRIGGGIERYRECPRHRPACLATAYYANVYFGLRQAVAIDSLRCAIDAIAPDDPFAEKKRVHYLSALVHTASISTSGTSHFAQPRHLRKDSELRAMARRRVTGIWELFEEFSREIQATVRETRHVPGNRVFGGDYTTHLAPVDSRDSTEPGKARFSFPAAPDLIYLDPPYTSDNYSRFYHALEVLVRYDYPRLATDSRGEIVRGRYPEIGQRFQSGFCHARRVEDEFRRVIHGAAATGAVLVISYATPTGFLLKRYARQYPGADPVARFEALCREAYRVVRTERMPLVHSGQGDSNLRINELLVICREPRIG